MAFKDLPPDSLPREKLLMRGAGALSDAELLAILLRTGIAGRSVLLMAQDLLDQQGGLAGLLNANAATLATVKGLGPAKRAEILAVMELARRATAAQLKERPVFDSPERVKHYLQMHLGHLGHEVFAVLFLNNQHHLLEMRPMFQGTLTQASVYPREVVKAALELGAAAVILAHNHPSGSVTPSQSDHSLTSTLKAALALVDVRVLDHLIVTQGTSLSMAEQGML